MATPLNLSADLVEFAEGVLGGLDQTSFRGWDHAQSQVWRVQPIRGSARYLKAFSENRKFGQELDFYQIWAHQLAPATPELIQHSRELKALILSEVPGRPLELGSEAGQEELAYRQAGRMLSQIHSIPYRDTDIPLFEALHRRTQSWCKRAVGIVPEAHLTRLKRKVGELEGELKGWKRVPCHRDYTPRNWLWDGTELYLIDFEHSRPDLHCLDFEKLRGHYWFQHPRLEAAFWEGYGRRLDEAEEAVLETCLALGAVATISWAHQHGDQEFERRGRDLLARVKL